MEQREASMASTRLESSWLRYFSRRRERREVRRPRRHCCSSGTWLVGREAATQAAPYCLGLTPQIWVTYSRFSLVVELGSAAATWHSTRYTLYHAIPIR